MGKVLLHSVVSLDGFMAGPNDEMDWVFAHSGRNAVVDEIVRTTGAVVMGRHTYDVAHEMTPFGSAYGDAWSGPHFVLTHHPPDPATVPRGFAISFVTDGLAQVVEVAKRAAGDRNVSVLGGDVGRQCLERGLLDEIVIHIAPILLGAGAPLFALDGNRVELVRAQLGTSGELTDLRSASCGSCWCPSPTPYQGLNGRVPAEFLAESAEPSVEAPATHLPSRP